MQTRRRFLAGAAMTGAADGTDWRFLDELKRELKT
ncbi:twin-arginine translocation signal domain-containing protein [Mesorhizobium prunaredense]|nr:twin-arginine translocation signal domain-containing protein [Mesorhizobium prunaredense]